MRVLTHEAEFEIDLELPMECWDRDEIDEGTANQLRLAYMAGYISATRDARSGKIGDLIKRVSRIQGRVPA